MPNMKAFRLVVQQIILKQFCYITYIMSLLGVAIRNHRDFT